MGEVVSFVGYRPPERFDSLPWTEVRVEEAATETGVYAPLETIALSPLDADPANPAARSFTTQLGTDVGYWYRVIFADADGDVSQPTTPVQNTTGSTVTADVYVSTDELFRVLHVRNPTPDQVVAGERVLAAAAGEINSFIARTGGLAVWETQLAAEVNLERAVEHWQQQESPFGLLGLGGDQIPIYTSRNSFYRHQRKLMPLKQAFGLA
jgi:hypothetical protein